MWLVAVSNSYKQLIVAGQITLTDVDLKKKK
jgi:hypothetical protein